mgnify:CR=1 FL=1
MIRNDRLAPRVIDEVPSGLMLPCIPALATIWDRVSLTSAFQLVPALAGRAKRLVVFQRRPSWMFPNPEYHAAVSPGHRWCLENVPEYARWYRVLSMWPQFDKAAGELIRVDPGWDDGGASCSAANRVMRDQLTAWIASQVADPALLEKVVPDYPPFGTRMLQDDGTWLSTLAREDVELVTSGVARVTSRGLVADDGTEVEVDAIVWATGFDTGKLPAIDLEGVGGRRLSDAWGDEPKLHLGITVPGFPNHFMIVGPNTGVLHSGNLIIVSECQVNYILDADIRSYFDSVSQDWLIRFLKHRISDPRMIRLIQGRALPISIRIISDRAARSRMALGS